MYDVLHLKPGINLSIKESFNIMQGQMKMKYISTVANFKKFLIIFSRNAQYMIECLCISFEVIKYHNLVKLNFML